MGFLRAAVTLIASQQTLIREQQAALEQAHRDLHDLQGLILDSQRTCWDIAVGARLAQENGIDISEDLDALISDLADSIANMEEHIVVSR